MILILKCPKCNWFTSKPKVGFCVNCKNDRVQIVLGN